MSNSFAPPLTGIGGDVTPAQIPLLSSPYINSSSSSSSDAASASASASSSSASIIIVIIVIATAVIVSAGIYLLLRFISRRFHRSSYRNDVDSRRHDSSSNLNSNRPHCHVTPSGILDSLPLFTFRSVNGNLGGGDCAVCLSKFEADDQLRLLPLCCHAFHAPCIDAWIVSNHTCPLCRSSVVSSDADLLGKIDSSEPENRGRGNNSFRVEIGSISRRGGGEAEAVEEDRRSYSIGGSFEYIVDEYGYEIPAGSTTQRAGISDCTSTDKESSVGIPMPQRPGDALAAEVSGSRNWLREYVDRLASVSISSRTMSLRSSGRFFSGSSHRNEHAPALADLEANRVGEEISELFRWLSGI